jgi:putative addiction module killer protein
MIVRQTLEFASWLDELRPWDQSQVEDRLDRIREHNHFGDRKFLGNDLFELRWRNGRRVYYAFVMDQEGQAALMLLGGSKNGQDRDIAYARKILARQAT